MTSPRLAIIDLGTNTFHLLAVEKTDDGWKHLLRKRAFVNLAEDGIGEIGPGAWQRGMDALCDFRKIVKENAITHIRAMGTAALRNAVNAKAFISNARQKTGIEIEVIDGMREASYIYRGVLEAIDGKAEDLFIVDIGGGSVEFTMAQKGEVTFSASYPIGVAILYERFHRSEPISAEQLGALDAFLESNLAPLISKYPGGLQFVGASGSFELLDRALDHRLDKAVYTTYPVGPVRQIYDAVRPLNLYERLNHPAVPRERAMYVVCSMHLINFLIERLGCETMGISTYAMKEGIAREWEESLDQ